MFNVKHSGGYRFAIRANKIKKEAQNSLKGYNKKEVYQKMLNLIHSQDFPKYITLREYENFQQAIKNVSDDNLLMFSESCYWILNKAEYADGTKMFVVFDDDCDNIIFASKNDIRIKKMAEIDLEGKLETRRIPYYIGMFTPADTIESHYPLENFEFE